ncbi:MAG: DUF2946 domain-containing protein [Rhizobacter sp.]
MSARRRAAPIILWVAVIAFVVGVLLPSGSQAFRTTSTDGWFEVCTSFGAKWVRAGESRNDSGGPSVPIKASHEHCAYCGMHAGDLAVPPAAISGLALVPLRFAVPERFLVAPRTLFAWAPAQARAPPQVA